MLSGSRHLLRRSTPVILSLVLLALAIVATVAEPTAMVTLRNAAFDTYQRWQPREYHPVGVRVIDIDDESLRRLGQWPWPRTILAELLGELQARGAAAIALDIVFAEPDRTSPRQLLVAWPEDPEVTALIERLPDHDLVFAEQVAQGGVVVGFVLTNNPASDQAPSSSGRFVLAGDAPQDFLPNFRGAVSNLAAFEEAAAGHGAINTIAGNDGVVRRLQLLMRHGDGLYPTLAAEALRVAEGAENYVVKSSGASGESRFGGRTGIINVRIGAIPVATDAQGSLWLHYTEPVAQRTIPAWQVLAGEVAAEQLDGAIVLVGTSAAGLLDLRLNALGHVTAGAEVHAQAIEQILQGTYLTRPDWATAAEILFMIAMWVVSVTLIPRFGALPAAIVGMTATAAAYLGSWLAFSHLRLLLDPTFPSLMALSGYLVCAVSSHWRTERDRRWIQQAFSSYISPNLVRHLIENPQELSLGGERRECSFVLSDLESFTSLVEASEPSLVVQLLNEYLEGIVRIALDHEGTLDRIVGDSVAVMFSAPAVQPDHAARAVACALEIDAFSRSFKAGKLAQGIAVGRTRIGVNTGMVTVGNVGGDALIDYRALGDAVNTTARLETINGLLGTNVCISGNTASACPGFSGRPVGTLVLKGKSEGVPAFEPLPPELVDAPATQAYLRAFELLEANDPEALAAFEALHAEAPDDPLAWFHLRRLQSGERGSTVKLDRK